LILEQRKALSRQIDNTLDQAQNVVRQMESVVRDNPMHPQSATYRNACKRYDADIQRYRRNFLTSVPATGSYGVDTGRFNDTYARVEATNNRLIHTEQAAYDSEATGQAILGTLHDQRERLENIDDKVIKVDETMDRTHGKLFRLGMKVMTDKFILIIIIIVEILIIFIMLFFKWIYPYIKPKQPTSGSDF